MSASGPSGPLVYQCHCLRVNQVYAEIHTFLPPYSKRLFIAMIHRKVFNIKIVNIHFKWRKFLRNIKVGEYPASNLYGSHMGTHMGSATGFHMGPIWAGPCK